VLKTNTES